MEAGAGGGGAFDIGDMVLCQSIDTYDRGSIAHLLILDKNMTKSGEQFFLLEIETSNTFWYYLQDNDFATFRRIS